MWPTLYAHNISDNAEIEQIMPEWLSCAVDEHVTSNQWIRFFLARFAVAGFTPPRPPLWNQWRVLTAR